MSLARSFALAGCLTTVALSGCYRAAEKAESKSGSGSASSGSAAAKAGSPTQVVVHGADIVDDRNSKALQMVTVAQLRDEERKRAESAAAEEANVARHQKPAPANTTVAKSVTEGVAEAVAKTAGSKPAASPSALPGTVSPSVASSATATGTKPTVAFDPYVRPAMQREGAQTPVEVRPSRSPQPKKLPPVDRTKVLAAPETTGGTLGITFDNLMFDMKPTDIFNASMLNDTVRSLFGKKIKLRGYIHPASALVEKGITQFVFVRDDQACCFGPGALLYDNVVVKMKPGKSTNYTLRPIAVEGVLSFQDTAKPGVQPLSIFQIDADSAE